MFAKKSAGTGGKRIEKGVEKGFSKLIPRQTGTAVQRPFVRDKSVRARKLSPLYKSKEHIPFGGRPYLRVPRMYVLLEPGTTASKWHGAKLENAAGSTAARFACHGAGNCSNLNFLIPAAQPVNGARSSRTVRPLVYFLRLYDAPIFGDKKFEFYRRFSFDTEPTLLYT